MKKAGSEVLGGSAEEERFRGDDGCDVGAGEASAVEQVEDGIGVGGGGWRSPFCIVRKAFLDTWRSLLTTMQPRARWTFLLPGPTC